jgi:uncharacterized membrane protein YkvI
MITGIIIYLIGFFLTLTFLKYYGVKIGFDYDKQENSWDDWDSNAQAYTAFSIMWFAVVPMWTVAAIMVGTYKFCKWYLKR